MQFNIISQKFPVHKGKGKDKLKRKVYRRKTMKAQIGRGGVALLVL